MPIENLLKDRQSYILETQSLGSVCEFHTPFFDDRMTIILSNTDRFFKINFLKSICPLELHIINSFRLNNSKKLGISQELQKELSPWVYLWNSRGSKIRCSQRSKFSRCWNLQLITLTSCEPWRNSVASSCPEEDPPSHHVNIACYSTISASSPTTSRPYPL